MITLINDEIGHNAQDSVYIFNGKAQTAQFSKNNMPLKSGNYTVQISTPTANVQASSVKALLGENGKNLTGSYVKDDPVWGKMVYFEKSIIINTN